MSDEVKTAAEAVQADALPRSYDRVHGVHTDPAISNADNEAVPKGFAKTSVGKKS